MIIQLSKRKRSQRSERQVARLLNGRVQPASGAINRHYLKADVKTDQFLIEDKVCGTGAYTINQEKWSKLSRQAWKNKLRPLFRINMDRGDRLYIMDEQTLMSLLRSEL